MTNQEDGLLKRRGRPLGRSVGSPIAVRLDPSVEAALDAMGAMAPDRPSRGELIRRIVTERLGPSQEGAALPPPSDGDLRYLGDLRRHLDDVLHMVAEAKPSTKRQRVIADVQRQIEEIDRATSDPSPVSSATIAEKANRAQSHAETAADAALEDVDVPAEVKTARRKALIDKPVMVAKARAKRKDET